MKTVFLGSLLLYLSSFSLFAQPVEESTQRQEDPIFRNRMIYSATYDNFISFEENTQKHLVGGQLSNQFFLKDSHIGFAFSVGFLAPISYSKNDNSTSYSSEYDLNVGYSFSAGLILSSEDDAFTWMIGPYFSSTQHKTQYDTKELSDTKIGITNRLEYFIPFTDSKAFGMNIGTEIRYIPYSKTEYEGLIYETDIYEHNLFSYQIFLGLTYNFIYNS